MLARACCRSRGGRCQVSTRQDLIHVSGGDLLMGSQGFYPEEAPVMRVLIDDLWIRSTLVTNAEFSTFVTSTGYVTTAEQEDRQGSVVFVGTPGPVPLNDWRQWWAWQPGANWRHPQGPDSSVEGRASHPVVHVSLHDARAYATWSGLEIPHEPEWEWCARGGLESATYTWGEEPNKGDELFANTWQGDFPFDNRGAHGWKGTSPVGVFPPNGYGLFDMAGNVWEWTDGAWQDQPGVHACCSGTATEGDLKVIKGGSHLCSPQYCLRYRPAARSPQEASESTSHLGFRCLSRRAEHASEGD